MTEAIRIGRTLLRMDSIAWIKVRRLSHLELATSWFLLATGVLFAVLVAWAKGTPWNLESLLGFVPIRMALGIRGSYRVASTGDGEDSYQERALQGTHRPADLARDLQALAPQVLEFRGPRKEYYYALRPDRIAWVTPWFELNLWPLWATLLFGAYWVMAPRSLNLGSIPILEDLHLLTFPAHGPGPALVGTALVLLGSVLAVVASFKQGVEVTAVGGVQDNFPMTPGHRTRLFEDLAGAPRPETRSEVPPAQQA